MFFVQTHGTAFILCRGTPFSIPPAKGALSLLREVWKKSISEKSKCCCSGSNGTLVQNTDDPYD